MGLISAEAEKIESIKAVYVTLLYAALWSLFAYSALNYKEAPFFLYLITSRIVFSALGVGIVILYFTSLKKYIVTAKDFYIVLSLFLQVSHGYFEGPLSIDFFNFSGPLFLLMSTLFNGTFRNWIKFSLIPYLVFSLLIIFSKDLKFNSHFSSILDNFSIVIFCTIVSIIVMRGKGKILDLQKNQEMKILQIAHDIRSPLEAIRSMSAELDALENQDKSILQNSIKRISQIANGLLLESKVEESIVPVNLYSLVKDIISEKGLEYGDKIIFIDEVESHDVFINARYVVMMRILSNLINNAFEAYDHKEGKVRLRTSSDEKNVYLKIMDHGNGMPKKLLAEVKKGRRSTKRSGYGLGFRFAMNEIEKMGAILDVDSVENVGTTITLKFYKINPPSFFVEKLELNNSVQNLICVDDDSSFLEAYKKKFSNTRFEVTTHTSLSTLPTELKDKKHFFFFDYDLGEGKDGLSFILDNELEGNSILVTSMFNNPQIQQKCERFGVKIISKQMFSSIHFEEEVFVLIDNDPLIQDLWKMTASKKGINLIDFFSVDEFLTSKRVTNKSTKIYIDSSLDDNKKGEIEAKKLYDLGFTNLFLVTGYPKDSIEKPSYIKEVFGKKPPF